MQAVSDLFCYIGEAFLQRLGDRDLLILQPFRKCLLAGGIGLRDLGQATGKLRLMRGQPVGRPGYILGRIPVVVPQQDKSNQRQRAGGDYESDNRDRLHARERITNFSESACCWRGGTSRLTLRSRTHT